MDILVNNAGIQHVARIEEFPVERWDVIIAINLTSAFHTTRLALPGMKQKNWGRIVNVASVHGLVGSAQKSPYVAAKHGLVGFTKVCGLETAQTGVTCNAICPGWVLTPLVQKQIDERVAREGISVEQARKELLAEKQPSLEFVTPEDLGALAVFLCSPAGNQVRGAAWNMGAGRRSKGPGSADRYHGATRQPTRSKRRLCATAVLPFPRPVLHQPRLPSPGHGNRAIPPRGLIEQETKQIKSGRTGVTLAPVGIVSAKASMS